MPVRERTFVDLDGIQHYADPEGVPRAANWEAVLADPDGSVGATYHPRIWVKTFDTLWARLELFSSGNLTVRFYIKDAGGTWRSGDYRGSYPTEAVPIPLWVAT